MTKASAVGRGDLVAPRVACVFHEEPTIQFGCERQHVSPQAGISLYGPRFVEDAQQHHSTVRVGFIGSGKSIGLAEQWMKDCADGVSGDEVNMDFPGYKEDRGFYSQMSMATKWREKITTNEIAAVSSFPRRRDRFEHALRMISEKIQYLSELDSEPQVIVLALPDDLLSHCKTVDFKDSSLGEVHRDFRRAIKAVAMRHRIPTQIILQNTTEATETSRNVDHKSRCAWNFFTGLHFKVGAAPWGPVMDSRGSLFIGVSFFRPLGTSQGTMRTSVAQAFDEKGEGIVLRGRSFRWDEKADGRSPHLNEEQARQLIDAAVARYKRETGQTPRRIVIHKSSEYWPGELLGFRRALASVQEYDLVSLRYNDRIRLLRQANYPVLRGTQFTIGSRTFLYTTGYIPSLRRFPHGHVPSPLEISEHHGDSSIETICGEIMSLTKLNWNSSFFASSEPITLKFSRTVGGVMKEMVDSAEPRPQFKYYI